MAGCGLWEWRRESRRRADGAEGIIPRRPSSFIPRLSFSGYFSRPRHTQSPRPAPHLPPAPRPISCLLPPTAARTAPIRQHACLPTSHRPAPSPSPSSSPLQSHSPTLPAPLSRSPSSPTPTPTTSPALSPRRPPLSCSRPLSFSLSPASPGRPPAWRAILPLHVHLVPCCQHACRHVLRIPPGVTQTWSDVSPARRSPPCPIVLADGHVPLCTARRLPGLPRSFICSPAPHSHYPPPVLTSPSLFPPGGQP